MGWLRCVGLISVVFWFRAGVVCLTLGVILYIIIIYYIIIHILLYTIIYYTLLLLYIISYTILFSSSDLFLSFPILIPSSSYSSSPSPLPSNTLLIQSIRVGIWISLFIFHKNLTPHVLSEWMVEVCRFEVCWNPVGELTWIVLILFRFSSDLSSFTILSIYLSIQSIRVGIWISLFIFQTHPTFDPACFIGWECRVVQF